MSFYPQIENATAQSSARSRINGSLTTAESPPVTRRSAGDSLSRISLNPSGSFHMQHNRTPRSSRVSLQSGGRPSQSTSRDRDSHRAAEESREPQQHRDKLEETHHRKDDMGDKANTTVSRLSHDMGQLNAIQSRHDQAMQNQAAALLQVNLPNRSISSHVRAAGEMAVLQQHRIQSQQRDSALMVGEIHK